MSAQGVNLWLALFATNRLLLTFNEFLPFKCHALSEVILWEGYFSTTARGPVSWCPYGV